MKTIKHSFEHRVRYADTDKMGVVYNGNYFTFFEIGRTEMMRSLGTPYTQYEAAGYYLPLVESHAEYIIPAFYDDILRIETELSTVLSAKVRWDYSIYRGDELLARGYTVHCFMDAKTMKATRPPKFYIDFIKAHI